MMKRFLCGIAAAAILAGSSAPAMAYFEDLHLIRSIYATAGTVEVGTDLSFDVSTFELAPGFVPPTSPLNAQANPDVAVSLFDGALNTLVVAYWAHDMARQDFYATGFLTTAYGGTDTDSLFMLGRKQSTADGTYNPTQNLYSSMGAQTAVLADKTTLGSYYNRFDVNDPGAGSMGANLRNDSYEMDMYLGALLTVGYVDQLLYKFDYNGSGSTVEGVPVAVIRTFLTSDGTTIDLNGDKIATVINPVPIPGGLLLLGSGLLALVGIRRRRPA